MPHICRGPLPWHPAVANHGRETTADLALPPEMVHDAGDGLRYRLRRGRPRSAQTETLLSHQLSDLNLYQSPLDAGSTNVDSKYLHCGGNPSFPLHCLGQVPQGL